MISAIFDVEISHLVLKSAAGYRWVPLGMIETYEYFGEEERGYVPIPRI
jgi:hypothetical protein